jgi:diguanylate cyclase (GGDEF)-like protein
MSGTSEQRAPTTEEDALAREEQRIDRAAVGSIFVSAALTVAVVAFFVITQADQGWQYFAYPAMAAVPLAIGAGAARQVRHMHVTLLRAHQARLVMRTIELEKMASHDELTDLYNRRYFYERFQHELARVRESRRTLSLITLDIDGLKKINDEYGHAVGDIMIANLARVIDKHIRTSDIPARLGGDEFAILMPETDKRGAFSLAERLWAELEEIPMYEHEGIRLLLNISIGVSGYPWGGEDIDEMVHWADADMYANKVSRRLPEVASPPLQTLKDDRFDDSDWR